MYRWLTNTWKEAQHHSLPEKCKSKSQWGTISPQSEWLLSKSLQTINAGENNKCGEKGTLLHCWWECKLVQSLWRTVWRFLKKLEIELVIQQDSLTLFSRPHFRVMKRKCHENTTDSSLSWLSVVSELQLSWSSVLEEWNLIYPLGAKSLTN